MKLSTTTKKIFAGLVIFLVFFGIVLFCQYISPETGIVIDKDIHSYKNSLEFRVLVKSDKFFFPIWIEVSENYYSELSINDTYHKNENSKMYSYWLEK